MKITLKRSGGFTGIPLSVSIDTDHCPEAEREALAALVEAARFDSLPEKIPSAGPGADRFSYRITVEKPGSSHTVEAGDSALPESLQPLVRRLLALGRARRK